MLTARDIMTPDVVTVPPEMGVEELAALLWEKKISGAPVVDGDGNLVGVVTESDLVDQMKKVHIPTAITLLDAVIFLESKKKLETELRKMTGTRVADICSRRVVTVTEETPLEEVATIMAEKKVHTLPVVRDNRVVGVIGKGDIIRTFLRRPQGGG